MEEDCVKIIRPGFGIAPKYYDQVIGKRVKRDVGMGQKTTWDCFLDQNTIE